MSKLFSLATKPQSKQLRKDCENKQANKADMMSQQFCNKKKNADLANQRFDLVFN